MPDILPLGITITVGARLKCHPAYKVEMTPSDRGQTFCETVSQPNAGVGEGVKGQSRLAGARGAGRLAAAPKRLYPVVRAFSTPSYGVAGGGL